MIHKQISVYTHTFHLDLEQNLPILHGNTEHMLQVIFNLLMNALVSLPDRACAVVLSTSYNRTTDRVQMRVQDEGVGIPLNILPSILEPYFSAWSEEGCLGIGLTVADQIIRRHGGALVIDSEPGKGTSVLVSLPLINKEA
jgi:C4-dicarboxylate-specific signal transduction histidine kinase